MGALTETDRKTRSEAFMKLAGFIGVMKTPQNADQAPIAMTAPVFMTHAGKAADSGAKGRVMQFVLPGSRFGSAGEVPLPTGDVVVKDVPERVMAVLRFSGNMKDDSIRQHADALKAAVDRDGLKLKDDNAKPAFAGYNPPWTPSFWRTNEVMYELAPDQAFGSAALNQLAENSETVCAKVYRQKGNSPKYNLRF